MAFGLHRIRPLAAAAAVALIAFGSSPSRADDPVGQSTAKKPNTQLAQVCLPVPRPVCAFVNGRWRNFTNRCYARRAGAGAVRSGRCGVQGNLRVCRNYARAAVNQNNTNRQRRCGYTGNRWQNSYSNHYNWCLRASQVRRNQEHNARNNALNQCNSRAGGCRNYARNAVNQHNTNLRRRCGYTGSRWQSNYRNHYNWCLRAPQYRRTQEHNARVRGLNQCATRGNKATYCRNYARRAVNHHQTNRTRRCGGWGARWHSNYSNHYNWCMRASPRNARSEDNARLVRLRRCGAAGGGACSDTRRACGWWRGRQYNFTNICHLRQRGARFIRYGRCGGGGGAGRACGLGNVVIAASSPGCGTKTVRVLFPLQRLRHGATYRQAKNSGVIGRGARPYGVCNMHTNIIYRCSNGRLSIQRVLQCQQNRNRNANCRLTR
jgi:hypothetical protein